MEDCLPADFAEKILELESELDGNHSLDVVRELN